MIKKLGGKSKHFRDRVEDSLKVTYEGGERDWIILFVIEQDA